MFVFVLIRLGFLIAAAVIPPLILMGVIYHMDQLDREPPGLLMSLFFRGVLTMFPILVLEIAADNLVEAFTWDGLIYLFLSYFVVPGFIEEGVKRHTLLRRVWQEPNFNYRFDGVVYAVFVSLGFAAVENIFYVLDNGFGVAVMRAILSIPGHAMFGVVMGVLIGRAKWLEAHGQVEQAQAALRRAFILPAVLHGLFDFLLMAFWPSFFVYFVILVICVVRMLRRAAREDGPIYDGSGFTGTFFR